MISANTAISGSYDYAEVARSVFIAIAASYAALDLTGRVTAARGRARLGWLCGGAVAMGIGIWAMHLKGMLAFHLPVAVEYHWPTVLTSLLVAILASAVALYVASRQKMGLVEALTGSVIMAGGIAGMHYIGMAAMRLPAVTRFSPLLVAFSILFAALFSLVALLMAFDLREETKWTVPRRLGSATVMGVAVAAMHYTGMAAASFISTSPPDLSYSVSISPLADNGIVIVTMIAIVAAITTSSVDRRAALEVQRLNQELEHRVAERALQLEGSEEKYRVIVEAASDAVISMDESGSILLANPATARIFGYDRAELIGKPLTVLMPEFMRKLHEAGFRRYLATSQRHLNWQGTEVTALRKNGRGFPVEVSFGEMISNGHRVFTGFIRDISEKKRAEDELREQKEVFQKIFEHIPATIAFIGRDGQVEMVNPEWERTLGWTLEEIRKPNLDLFAEFYPDPQYRQWILQLISASTGEWTDLKVRVRDGRVIDLVSAVVHLSDGTSIAIGRDVTERKRAEEALRTSERRQHKIAKQLEAERARLVEAQAVAKVGSWEAEWPSLEISWSEQTHRIFETDPFHFQPSRPEFVEFIHPEDRAKVDAAFQASLDKRAPSNVEYRIVMADGRVKVVEERWRVFHDEQGRPIRLMGTCRDVTERKLAEAELREGEARFRLVADSAPVMIWMSATDKLCTYFNKPWLDFTGRSIDSELGNGWAEGVHPADLQRCLDTYIQAFEHREAFRMQYRLRRYDGEFRWVLDIGVPRFNPDGSFAGYIGSCIDVTEQRRAEEQLHQAQAGLARVTRVAAMGELAATIAHEVNQPLAAVVTNASASLRWLAGQPPNLEEALEAIERTVREATRASNVIGRIRALLQKGPPQMERLDVNAIIREVLTLAGTELLRGGVVVQTNLAQDVPDVLGDRVQLQQVLLNLLLNGVEAMSTVTDRPRELIITSASHSDGVLIQVRDSGEGVDPEQADHIFDPFFTTKPQGIGMGLSVGRSIVEAHGGRLWFTPGPSHGVVFQFTMPKADTSDERAA
ncbi:MAG: PAS domain S-box protein [Candidatus Sulfotelmatobacter sp.]